jgi:hypothetical protein
VGDNTLTRVISRRNQFKSTAEFSGEELGHCSNVDALEHGLQTAIHHDQRTALVNSELGLSPQPCHCIDDQRKRRSLLSIALQFIAFVATTLGVDGDAAFEDDAAPTAVLHVNQ